MEAASKARTVLLVLLSVLMFAFSGASAWAVVSDYQTRGLVSKGVTLGESDLSGMTEMQVRAAIEEAVSAPMLRPVTVTGDNKSWVLDPKGIVDVDVDAMVDQAYAPRHKATLVERLNSRLTGAPLPAEVKPAFSIDASAVAVWVKERAAEVNRKPKDAVRKPGPKYSMRVTTETLGASVAETAAIEQIAGALTADAALASDSRVVSLPVTLTSPKVTAASFKTGIVVSLNQCRIYLYKGSKLVKIYRCAPGRAAFPTPQGDFKIMTKLAYSPWYNPGSPWAASMPAMIPGGPGNPMGVHKIGIDSSGIFMHGIPPSEFGSIGTHASHGCMRMMPSDVKDLFGRVSLGDPVYIRP
ncbi:MAG: L,D-transpeptidase family protein [Coriobacteriia bacterium]|nr:L,D-transpeptidase family protein [Coriobacteriia bacterium]